MAYAKGDMIKETSTTTGTGTYSLAGAVTGYRTFVAGIGNNNKCYYKVTDGVDWEINLGQVVSGSPDTISRIRLLKSSTGSAINWGAGTRTLYVVPAAEAIKDAAPDRGHIWGLGLSNAGGDTTNDITIAAGEATDDAGEVKIQLTSAITKQIDATWAVGTNAGGMNTGSVANDTWYEVHLIYREDTGVVDVMFTTTANRATLPTNYTHKRRIGWVRRGTATNLQFTQVGDHFTLSAAINDVAITKTTTATNVTLTVPPSTIARFRATLDGNTSVNANSAVMFKELAEDTSGPTLTTGIGSLGYIDLATCAAAGHFELRANSSSQIKHDSEVAQGNLDISTFGWIDHRGRFDE